jgi:hypothetical protein
MTAMPLRLERAPIVPRRIETAPSHARAIDRRHNNPPAERASQIHPGVFAVFVGFFVAMLGIFGLVFMSQKEALFSVVVSIVYTIVYFAVPYVVWRVATAHGMPASDQSFAAFLKGELSTCTGPLKGWEAAIQIWSIPAALTLATAGLGLVIALS